MSPWLCTRNSCVSGFVDKAYAWHFSGEDDLQVERIEFGQTYGGGGRLIHDGWE